MLLHIQGPSLSLLESQTLLTIAKAHISKYKMLDSEKRHSIKPLCEAPGISLTERHNGLCKQFLFKFQSSKWTPEWDSLSL